MAPRLSGPNCNFFSFFCLPIPKRDLNSKKRPQNIEVYPESLGAMLEYRYMERGLFKFQVIYQAEKTIIADLHVVVI